ncbi:hypothetical protein [Maritimibacter sp. DP1N21-5]|uniref:hypothetical protein n=1 Tax=Maritimibacter sp. DP1N21-5 TaxID=2836867 RepID=UPI001C43FC94|nr:hypothetical protein [Maritimibacter sp. DP1N21-5]MBV7410730.1 hypothetical protein [Maritimibacter sp. DP1N21-5]
MGKAPPDRTRSGSIDNPDQLRDEIDRGGTGDKVAYPDPAAAPLGTDDEAAGHPPDPEQVRRAAAVETARDESEDRLADTPEGRGHHRRAWVLPVAAVALALIGVAALIL